MPTVNVNGIEVYYETAGSPDAPPLLLIGGLTDYTRNWFAQVPSFLDDFYVITFDNRGAGKSTQPKPGYTMVDMADDTAALLDALNIDEAFVFGISMGGMIALNLAARHPQKVTKLAVGCTTPGGEAGVWPEQEVVAAMTAPSCGDRRQDFYNGMWFGLADDTVADNRPLTERLADNAVDNPQTLTGFMGQFQAVTTHDVTGALAELSMPVMVMHGDLDILIPFENGRYLADNIPGAEFKVYPGAAHMYFVERAAAVNDDLRRFFCG